MRPELICGALIGLSILALLLVPIGIRVFGGRRHTERWGRYEYTITRGGSFVFKGTSFRLENPLALDEVAGRILTEWFYLPEGENALIYDSCCDHYHCISYLRDYGVGEAYGRR